jgi:Collagen triple helix repeat (20 copies)
MALTPWRVAVLLCVAAICVAIATLDVAAPGVPASCNTAKSSLNHHLIGNAETAYDKILIEEPSSTCASQGIKAVVTAWCAWGKTLTEHRATVEAVKVYTTALEDQPMNAGVDQCALEGLEGANSSVTAASCPNALQAACDITLVNVYGVNGKNGTNGRSGLDGRNGLNGRNGLDGKNGSNGHSGVNGANGKNGANGRNGKNGSNGHDGVNGKNGQNGVGIGNASLCEGAACHDSGG